MILVLALLVLTAITFAACTERVPSAPASPDATQSTVFAQMQENRIDYVGDTSEVGRLLAFLPSFDENYTQNMFSLQTQDEPYGITIYYEPSEKWNGNSMIVTEEMAVFSEYLFESIGNLGYVEFAYRRSNSDGYLDKSEYQILLRIYRE